MAIVKYPAALYGVTLTSAAANTKGSWVELAASLGADIIGMYVSCMESSAPRPWLVDIGIGAAASETVAISNLAWDYAAGAGLDKNQLGVYVPIAIASGTRVSARCQNNGNAQTIQVAITVVEGTGSAVPVTYGASTTTSRPVAIVADATTPGVKGAYVEVTAATSAALDYLIVILTTDNNTTMSDAQFSVDIATGAASSEVVLIPDCSVTTSTAETLGPLVWAFPVSVPVSTRIAARCAATFTGAGARLGVEVIGVSNSGFNGGTSGGGEHSAVFIG